MGIFVILRPVTVLVKRNSFHMAFVLRDIHLDLFPIRAIGICAIRDYTVEAFIAIRRETSLRSI